VHGGVEQHHAGEQVGVIDGPAEGDGSAPVVPERDHRPLEAEGLGEVGEVTHPAGERAGNSGAFGEAHVELVDGNDPPGAGSRPAGGGLRGRGCGIRRLGDEVAPEVGPGRVAVHAQHGAENRRALREQFGAVVEQVPGAGLGQGRAAGRKARLGYLD
jgi:hypothetical protein